MENIFKETKSKKRREAMHVARLVDLRNAFRILVGKPESKRPRGRNSCRWEDDIKIYLQETECKYVDWIHMAQDSVHWLAVVKANNETGSTEGGVFLELSGYELLKDSAP